MVQLKRRSSLLKDNPEAASFEYGRKQARMKRKGVSKRIHISPRKRFPAILIDSSEAAKRMAEAATTFLASLTAQQRTRVVYPVESEERFNWHYIPRARQGIPFNEKEGSQQKLAHRLIATGLSASGYSTALAIMSLETILKQLEGPSRRFERDPDLYYVTLFGSPGDTSLWGWRFEGHHISLNFLLLSGRQIAFAPTFFGANPAQVPQGYPLAGFRALPAEEDLARHLLTSFSSTQRRNGVIDGEAPPDILTRAEAHVNVGEPAGIPASEMTEAQARILWDLILTYGNRMPDELAHRQMEQIEKDGKKYIRFAWAGSEEEGQPHYYRLHGPSFLVEYDNTQDNANHIHSVWRDLRNDWGEDLLRIHYEKSHGSGK